MNPPPLKILMELLRSDREKSWEEIARKSPQCSEGIKYLKQHALRHYQPWPDWVLRIGCELMVTNYPRVDKQRLFQILKFIHDVIFGLPPSLPKDITAAEMKTNLLYFLGHIEQHSQNKFAEAEATLGKLPELELEKKELRKKTSQLWGKLLLEFGELGDNPVTVMEKVVEAKNATFDEAGNLRTTPATKLYQAIFDDWPSVEKMSGQAELTRFLDSSLGKRDLAQKYNLVRKLCERVEISFKRTCQEAKQGE